MKKILVIDNCEDCPYFDRDSLDCNRLDRKVSAYIEPIPEDCPLENYKEKEDEKS